LEASIIRDQLITYFFKFFEQVVHDEHLYVLETPLFRGACARPPATSRRRSIATAKPNETPRAPSSAELRDHALQRSRRNQPEGIPTVHRQGNEVEVLAHGHRVEYAPKQDASGILTFYTGKNTPERKDFIMGNLVVAVEE
jgi:topoisomerase IV subunit B